MKHISCMSFVCSWH